MTPYPAFGERHFPRGVAGWDAPLRPPVVIRPSVFRLVALPSLALLTLGAAFWLFLAQRPSAERPAATDAAPPSWLTIYLTDPVGPQSETLRGGPDARLAEAIDAAGYTVDVAIYHLNLWSVRDALLRAARRGLRVRVVVESDGLFDPEVQDLVQAGIPVLGDRREPLMHDKFTVIDGVEIWTGSMNYSVGSAYRDNNVLLRLRSSALAENYAGEFDEMFEDDRFGPLSVADTPHPVVAIGDSQVETLFAPDDGVAARLIELIAEAESEVDFLAFTFTSDPLAEALFDAAGRGVTVRGVIEREQAEAAGSDYARMRQSGIDVRLDNSPGTMHHKLLLIDGRIVSTGSYNFTRSAEQANDENVVILHDRQAAETIQAEFLRLYGAASP
jgi:phosphatidylserine/phosphatidylglycerophosphate/cardiolipin synthase-like enzyme